MSSHSDSGFGWLKTPNVQVAELRDSRLEVRLSMLHISFISISIFFNFLKQEGGGRENKKKKAVANSKPSQKPAYLIVCYFFGCLFVEFELQIQKYWFQHARARRKNEEHRARNANQSQSAKQVAW